MLRIIHTADWHLGHSLHGCSRQWEHARFLEWLLETLGREEADALLIAGDLFDSANPPAAAQRAFFEFLAGCRQLLPELDIVVVAGNHDSPARLEAPAPMLAAFGVHTVGMLPRRPAGDLASERLLIPLRAKNGEVEAWCAALPYLRSHDLPTAPEAEDPLVEGARLLHQSVSVALEETAEEHHALVATGHCYMVGTRLSELSERKILGGNQHALPADIFPDTLSYVALGHLHLAQRVGSRGRLHYAGSPLPLSLAEANYHHQVLAVDLEGRAPAEVRPIAVPRAVDMLQIPAAGPLSLDEVLAELAGLDLDRDLPPEQWPYLELRVSLDEPRPELRETILATLDGQPVRLLKISVSRSASAAPEDQQEVVELGELQPDEVFRQCYRQHHEEDPPDRLSAAFHELVEQVREEEA